MEDAMAVTILKELREFREENNKRWEKNDKRWEENDERWNENEKRWEENNKRWKENDKRWEENNRRWDEMNQRVGNLEKARNKDRTDIIEVLDTMQKSIDEQFTDMKNYFNAKLDKIYSAQRISDIEQEQFRKIIGSHEKILKFYNARLNYLEEWKEKLDLGDLATV